MKSSIKDVVAFIAAVIAEMYFFLQVPYMEVVQGYGDGFVILVPVFMTPLVGLLLGLLAERKFIFLLTIVVAILSVLLMTAFCQQFMIEYFLTFTLGTLAGIIIGIGLRKLIVKLTEFIRERRK
jgi:hypothetical protein